MAKKHHSSNSGLSSAAKAAVSAKYGPQFSALADLLAQAQGDYATGVRQADLGAKYIKSNAESEIPRLLGDQQRIAGFNQAALDKVLPTIQAGGPTGTTMANEAAIQANNLGLSGTAAATILRNSAARAQQAAEFQKSQLYDALTANKQKIGQQATELASNAGDYGSKVLTDLFNAAKDRQTKTSVAQIGATSRKDVANINAKARKDAAAVKAREDAAKAKEKAQKDRWLSPEQQGKFADALSAAVDTAKRLQQHYGRHEAAQILLQGRSPMRVTKDAKGNPLPVSVTIPGVPKIPQLLASVALDLAYDGHISHNNVRQLHSRKVKVKALGYPTLGSLGDTVSIGTKGIAGAVHL